MTLCGTSYHTTNQRAEDLLREIVNSTRNEQVKIRSMVNFARENIQAIKGTCKFRPKKYTSTKMDL